MATGPRTAERLSMKYPQCSIKTAIIGDSQAKYLYQHFNAYSSEAPASITYSGGRFSDVMQLLEYVPETVSTLILHIGTNDLAKDGAQVSLEHLYELLSYIRSTRPGIGPIYISLVLPRSANRRRRFSNHQFVWWFNKQVTKFNIEVSRLCRSDSGTFYIHHAFSEMPARRVLAADGVHPSFEGVALLALHYQQVIMKNTKQEPAGWSDTPPTIRIPDAADTGSHASPDKVYCDTLSTSTLPRTPQSSDVNLRQRKSSLRDDHTPQRCNPTSPRQYGTRPENQDAAPHLRPSAPVQSSVEHPHPPPTADGYPTLAESMTPQPPLRQRSATRLYNLLRVAAPSPRPKED
ncbi:hypothetical protein HPB47_001727 [Ixodes persulcatus]|uniref:Uncharacterized protein n=1 Tax=Ixodes persulcatus TaxID=34615 RepID=A0AC60PN70_IXOPE|nr:hypothetical protein HPB47_001727 [Ixodes persulcatus]